MSYSSLLTQRALRRLREGVGFSEQDRASELSACLCAKVGDGVVDPGESRLPETDPQLDGQGPPGRLVFPELDVFRDLSEGGEERLALDLLAREVSDRFFGRGVKAHPVTEPLQAGEQSFQEIQATCG